MCRVVGAYLRPLALREIFFKPSQTPGTYVSKTYDEVAASLRAHREFVQDIATDCAKKSTKAGYDAAGIGVGVLDLRAVWDSLPEWGFAPDQKVSESQVTDGFRQHLTPKRLVPEIKVSKDGGDFLETHQRLNQRLALNDLDYVYAWS